ncbi:MAG: methyltransferase [Trueperella sp.]|nr:methyltransferase [Trueperella sp.]
MSEHYFSATPESELQERTIAVQLHGQTYQVHTANGVFSPDRLDTGTQVLLKKVPVTQLPADALAVDLGCGWGAVSLALATQYPEAQVWGVDVNERALALAERNCATFPNVTIKNAATALADLRSSGQQLDLIWSNPPIRIGKTALHELLTDWLELLAPSGVAYLVVQRNLGADSLANWLTNTGFPAQKLASQKGYRILEVRRQG